MSEKLKRAVIKEELVALTGDFKKAIILNQFIYWSERVKDFDRFIHEENERIKTNESSDDLLEPQYGWIYKTAEELSDEIMMKYSKSAMRNHINELVEKGWLSTRLNPRYKFDKTIQYHVNIHKIQTDLQAIGYFLEGYKAYSYASPKNGLRGSESGHRDDEKWTAIPEITLDITSKNLKQYESPHSSVAFAFDELNKNLSALDKNKKEYYQLTQEHFNLLISEEKDLTYPNTVCTSAPVGVLLWSCLLPKKSRKLPVNIKASEKSMAKALVGYIKTFNRLPNVSECLVLDECLSGSFTPMVMIKGFYAAKDAGYSGELNEGMKVYIEEVKEMESAKGKSMAIKKTQEKHPNWKPTDANKPSGLRQISESEEF